jgi:hypothetical protein
MVTRYNQFIKFYLERPHEILIQASSIEVAKKKFDDESKTWMCDFELKNIGESKITSVI